MAAACHEHALGLPGHSGYGISFVIYMSMIKRLHIGPVFAAAHLEVVTVTLFSVYGLGDRLSPLQALGCCCIVAGVLVLAATEAGHSTVVWSEVERGP